MTPPALEFRPLRTEDENAFMDAVREFQQHEPWDFALGYDNSTEFPEYVRRNEQWSQGKELPPGYVPSSFYVGIVNGIIVGRLSLRHELNAYLFKIGGHIGYGVRPTQRRRGYATAMLQQAIPIAAKIGIKCALLTCDVGNIGSMTVIERCGGVLESVTDDPALEIQKRRYWISTI